MTPPLPTPSADLVNSSAMPDEHPMSGSLFMVVAPSGAGKSTLVNALLAQEQTIKLSISYTTRPPRPGNRMAANTTSPRWKISAPAISRANSWNGLKCIPLLRHFAPGDCGANAVRHRRFAGNRLARRPAGQEAVSARRRDFHPAAVHRRAGRAPEKRGQDEPQVITRRILPPAVKSRTPEFEYVIINQEFASALSELTAIVKATRCRFSQQAVRNALFVRPTGHPCKFKLIFSQLVFNHQLAVPHSGELYGPHYYRRLSETDP